MEIKNLDRKYFEKNLADYKLDKENERLEKLLDGVTLDSIEEMGSVLRSDIMNLNVEESAKNDMKLDETTKLLYINVIEQGNKVLGAMNFAYKETGKEGLVVLSEIQKYLPTLVTAMSNLGFSETLEKLNPYLNRSVVSQYKPIDITKDDIEVGEYHDMTSNLIAAPLKLLFSDIDMKSNKLNDDQKKRLKYMTNIEMAFNGLMKLELMGVEEELKHIDKSNNELYEIKENYKKFLESNRLQNVFLDYDILGDDLFTSIYFKDIFGISTFKITRTFKDVFKGQESELKEYTTPDFNSYNLNDIENSDISFSKKLKLFKEGMSVRIDIDFDEDRELTQEEKEHYLVENNVFEIRCVTTPIDTMYRVYRTMNFLQTIVDYDKDIYEHPSEILKWLPRLNVSKEHRND